MFYRYLFVFFFDRIKTSSNEFLFFSNFSFFFFHLVSFSMRCVSFLLLLSFICSLFPPLPIFLPEALHSPAIIVSAISGLFFAAFCLFSFASAAFTFVIGNLIKEIIGIGWRFFCSLFECVFA